MILDKKVYNNTMKKNIEIVGTLSDYRHNGDMLNISFLVHKEIVVPSGFFSDELLDSLKNKRVGIMNIDGEYKYRIPRG